MRLCAAPTLAPLAALSSAYPYHLPAAGFGDAVLSVPAGITGPAPVLVVLGTGDTAETPVRDVAGERGHGRLRPLAARRASLRPRRGGGGVRPGRHRAGTPPFKMLALAFLVLIGIEVEHLEAERAAKRCKNGALAEPA